MEKLDRLQAGAVLQTKWQLTSQDLKDIDNIGCPADSDWHSRSYHYLSITILKYSWRADYTRKNPRNYANG